MTRARPAPHPNPGDRLKIIAGFGAIALGLAVALIGGLVWSILLSLNLALSPALPWSAGAMAVLLALGWTYLSGQGWPRSTREARAVRLPQRALSTGQWVWALAASITIMAAALCALLIAFRLFPIPVAPLPPSAQSSPLTAMIYLARRR